MQSFQWFHVNFPKKSKKIFHPDHVLGFSWFSQFSREIHIKSHEFALNWHEPSIKVTSGNSWRHFLANLMLLPPLLRDSSFHVSFILVISSSSIAVGLLLQMDHSRSNRYEPYKNVNLTRRGSFGQSNDALEAMVNILNANGKLILFDFS